MLLSHPQFLKHYSPTFSQHCRNLSTKTYSSNPSATTYCTQIDISLLHTICRSYNGRNFSQISTLDNSNSATKSHPSSNPKTLQFDIPIPLRFYPPTKEKHIATVRCIVRGPRMLLCNSVARIVRLLRTRSRHKGGIISGRRYS